MCPIRLPPGLLERTGARSALGHAAAFTQFHAPADGNLLAYTLERPSRSEWSPTSRQTAQET